MPIEPYPTELLRDRGWSETNCADESLTSSISSDWLMIMSIEILHAIGEFRWPSWSVNQGSPFFQSAGHTARVTRPDAKAVPWNQRSAWLEASGCRGARKSRTATIDGSELRPSQAFRTRPTKVLHLRSIR